LHRVVPLPRLRRIRSVGAVVRVARLGAVSARGRVPAQRADDRGAAPRRRDRPGRSRSAGSRPPPGPVASPQDTLTEGDLARAAIVPELVARSVARKCAVPAEEGAFAPGPPPDLAPYTIFSDAPGDRSTPLTVTVMPAIDTEPLVDVTSP